ncbi:hypothetical protein LshimejAT787_0407480 [Lyophyllum shimeji]|uniref:C2H2-type domain-containing protein n=1 Tax=Lyophyllum shimeji TaxID=47721 RepID=A0A9P3PLW8_LYOSH|nr:hypothetical protein LshimejAT787_0407480 [Lyophyllum shimeji]
MQVSTVTISSESIVELAQATIVPFVIRCEWGSGRDVCNVVVACSEALKKHYHWHLRDLKSKKQKFAQTHCQLPRCSAPLQSSFEALRHHLEASHLSRTAVLCPIAGCCSGGVLRTSTISKHFLDEHAHLEGTTVRLPSALLKPSWRPFYPSEAVKPPPPLPPDPSPGCVLVTAVPALTRGCRKLLTSPPDSSQLSTSITAVASPRRQSQRQIPKRDKAEDDEDELPIPDFAPLPVYRGSTSYDPQEFVVWRRPTVFEMDVARPQRMLEGPFKEAPRSIFYDVLAKQVEEMKSKGILG